MMIGDWVERQKFPTHDEALRVGGYFYVRHFVHNKYIVSIRYFDESDSSWWFPSNHGLNPNNSFEQWLRIEKQDLTAEQALEALLSVGGVAAVVVGATYKWSNERQEQTNEVQYQVFTNKNGCCAPANSIADAVQNALKAMLEPEHLSGECRYES